MFLFLLPLRPTNDKQFSDSKYLRSKNAVDKLSRSKDVWRRLEEEVCLHTTVLRHLAAIAFPFRGLTAPGRFPLKKPPPPPPPAPCVYRRAFSFPPSLSVSHACNPCHKNTRPILLPCIFYEPRLQALALGLDAAEDSTLRVADLGCGLLPLLGEFRSLAKACGVGRLEYCGLEKEAGVAGEACEVSGNAV